MYKVSISRCADYRYDNVEESVFQCLDNLPEIKQKIKAPGRVLIKANLVKACVPSEAVTTHPSVVQAVVRYFQRMGCSAVIGDSPGDLYEEDALKRIYRLTGMEEVARNTGCDLNYDTSIVKVKNEKAVALKRMSIIKIVEDVDYIVSVSKLKTHVMMAFTGAVKNLFGVIPGRTKVKYHHTMPDADSFAEHLVDICEYVRPELSIIDGVEGMEGNGPSAGDKRYAGLIMCSENPYALDVAATGIIGLNSLEVPTIAVSVKRKIFTGDIKDIEICGVPMEEIDIKPFQLPESVCLDRVPSFNRDICIGCGVCKESCPQKAIKMINDKPAVNLGKCIQCFCCHELCPAKAVEIVKTNDIPLGWL